MKPSVLFVGHCYYNCFFLSNGLKDLGYKSKVINIDTNSHSQGFYLGQDELISNDLPEKFAQLLNSFIEFDVFHFSNRGGVYFLNFYNPETSSIKKMLRLVLFTLSLLFSSFFLRFFPVFFLKLIFNSYLIFSDGVFKPRDNSASFESFLRRWTRGFPQHWEIYFLKAAGIKFVYSNNGCHDGVTPTSFSQWKPYNVCKDLCPWYGTTTCDDSGAIKWGKFRNRMMDYVILLGGNRADFNKATFVHEVPEFYCLDKDYWKPNLVIPDRLKIELPEETIKIYHSVGNYDTRTRNGVNVKCTHVYLPLIDELKKEGYKVELVFCHNVPVSDVRLIMAQCDIVVDMLTYGWFGANIREAMMLGIPSVCYLRHDWLVDASREIPDYIKELPIVNANPDNIKSILIKLINDHKLRRETGKLSRDFAVKWHSKEAGAQKLAQIYESLV